MVYLQMDENTTAPNIMEEDSYTLDLTSVKEEPESDDNVVILLFNQVFNENPGY